MNPTQIVAEITRSARLVSDAMFDATFLPFGSRAQNALFGKARYYNGRSARLQAMLLGPSECLPSYYIESYACAAE